MLRFCADIEAKKPSQGSPAGSRCIGYVQGAVDALETLKMRDRVYCPPPALPLKRIVLLFKSEAKVFPEALSNPAAVLIAGMLIKFFPCGAKRGRGA